MKPTTTNHARRILVVDDHADAALALGQLLEVLGHTVRLAYGGAEALELAAAFQPEVIFLDLAMPEMDGFAVARRLRQTPVLDRVLVVALTGHGRDADLADAAAAGMDWHLLKPATPGEVLAILAEPATYRGRLASPALPLD
jgi:CheY-like chemotaxis protein